MLLIEDSRVRDECIEHVSMCSAEVVYRVSSIAGSACCHLAYERLRLHFFGSRKVILHVEARIIAGYLLCPLLAECSGSTSVWKHDDVSLICHQSVVPAVRPALAERALRASKADCDSRVSLRRIELRRVENPCEHVFSVYRLHISCLCAVILELAEDVLVLMCYLCI